MSSVSSGWWQKQFKNDNRVSAKPWLWTAKSGKTLPNELAKQQFDVSIPTVLKIRKKERYSLQANAKTPEGRWHPDRDQQLHHINEQIEAFTQDQQPVILVDTKKKILVTTRMKRSGRSWGRDGGQGALSIRARCKSGRFDRVWKALVPRLNRQGD
ncbi:MAG: hypothetical protein OXE94_07480 [Aestuariivita sp.]|nr:hypothetical protein [Aestuariivita sp.]MCY4203111.1 hypothetical protein [Aestuariivita sp.]